MASKTIWVSHNEQGDPVYLESWLGPVNKIVRCCNCNKRFTGRRSFQDETRAAMQAANQHAKEHPRKTAQ